jgi:hypothetical protein
MKINVTVSKYSKNYYRVFSTNVAYFVLTYIVRTVTNQSINQLVNLGLMALLSYNTWSINITVFRC